MASSIALDKRRWVSTWTDLPAEIRGLILDALIRDQDGGSLSSLATVSQEWQVEIERHNFARIRITPSRLVDFGAMVHRNRTLVSYIWFCLELPDYDCTTCAPPFDGGGDDYPNILDTTHGPIKTAFENLFSVLSTWDPRSRVVLDISFYSLSDAKHWFKYITILPDHPSGELGRRISETGNTMPDPIQDDLQHGWVAGRRISPPPAGAIKKVFLDVMDSGILETHESWWKSLPSVPVVTTCLLRQQNRRRWEPCSLAYMLTRLPRLQEFYYEPWREFDKHGFQEYVDLGYRRLFRCLAQYNKLKKLVIFENFNQQYPSITHSETFRVPEPAVSQEVAVASHQLEYLSASFMVDASHFLAQAVEPSWEWPNLTALILTSQILEPHGAIAEVEAMLQAAASATLKMPKLKIMEIWNGRQGVASLFKFQAPEESRPATITWRSTWSLTLPPPVIRVWEAVVIQLGGYKVNFIEERLDETAIHSLGDAVHYLLLNKVIRPVSLQQIRMEQHPVE